MSPKTKNSEKPNSKIEEPISSVEKIKRYTIRQLVGLSWKERHEKIMEESENFMNELYKISKEFTPTNEVFFEVEEENGTVKEINFRDLRKEPSGKRPAKERDFLAGVHFLRSPNGSFFSLTTTKPTVYFKRTGGTLEDYRPRSRSTSTTDYHHKLPHILEQIKSKIETVNSAKLSIEKKTANTRSQIMDTFQQRQ